MNYPKQDCNDYSCWRASFYCSFNINICYNTSLVVAHRVDRRSSCSNLHDSSVTTCCQIKFPQIFLLDIVKNVSRHGMSRSLPLQLEDYHASIMTSCEEIESWMAGQYPEPIERQLIKFVTNEGFDVRGLELFRGYLHGKNPN